MQLADRVVFLFEDGPVQRPIRRVHLFLLSQWVATKGHPAIGHAVAGALWALTFCEASPRSPGLEKGKDLEQVMGGRWKFVDVMVDRDVLSLLHKPKPKDWVLTT